MKGPEAHEVYRWLKAEHGFEPRWNFNKVLLDGDGEFVASWGSNVRPGDSLIVEPVERLLNSGS